MPPLARKLPSIAGVLPIAHTPFHDDDSIDEDSLAREIDWAFAHGANGFGTGMVSELLRLTADERIHLTRLLGSLKRGRGVFFAGIGAESTAQAVIYGRAAEDAGADAVMAIPPTTTALPDAALAEYFATIATQVGLPLIVQDASSYVGREIPLSVSIRLLDEFGPDKILFKPEANPLGPNLSLLRDGTKRRARIYEGSGGIALVDSYRRGIAGTMPGMEFLPAIVALWRALERQDEDAIYKLSLQICALVSLQLQAGLDGFLAVEKHLLHRQGIFSTDRRRKPYKWSLDPETSAELDRLMERLNLAVAEFT
ncbi:MAG: dihydrodipicolinate synthase family protein [Planctomycetaceae bacterium]|nr:dihydrodipicolinate synthase family protein [Planctomycetaceae bacterium]